MDKKDFIIDEMLGLNSTNDVDISTKEEPQAKEEQVPYVNEEPRVINKVETGYKFGDSEFTISIKDTISSCINELNSIDSNNAYDSIVKSNIVNEKTLNLVVLLLSNGNRIKSSYPVLMNYIEEQSKLNHGNGEVLNYLVRVRNLIIELYGYQDKFDQVIIDNNATKTFVSNADKEFKNEINESVKSRKLVDSKCNRLARRWMLNNFYIGICLLLIIAVAVFVIVTHYAK